MTATIGERNAAGLTTIVTRVRERARAAPGAVAMRHKDLGIWREVTWAAYWARAELVAHALLALGVEPGDRIAVHSENRPEWLYTDLGAVAVRAVTVGLYPTSPAAEVAHLLTDSGATILLAEDQEQVDKALAVAAECPELRHIVYLEPRGVRGRYTDPRLLAWPDLLALGERHRAEHPDAVERRMAAAEPGDVMTLIYTSGTTGRPRA